MKREGMVAIDVAGTDEGGRYENVGRLVAQIEDREGRIGSGG